MVHALSNLSIFIGSADDPVGSADDPVVRMEMLGHTSLEMTDITYGHATREQHKEAAEEINRLFREEK